MKRELVVLGLLCLVLAIVPAIKTRSTTQEQGSKPDTLQGVAEQAKARGEQEIRFPTGNIHSYGVARTFDDALSNFSLVVARLVNKESYIEGSQEIRTWYKFKLIETLHQAPRDNCPSCQAALTPPNDMLPLGDDDFLVNKDGGTVVIYGVKITTYDPDFPDLSASRNYMLFVSPDSAAKIHALRMGPHGIYVINDNDGIEPVIKGEDDRLLNDIKGRFGNSVTEIRAKLKKPISR